MIFKKHMRLFMLILLLNIILCSNIIALQPDSNTSQIRIGYIEDFGTFTTPSFPGLEGYGYEYFKEISKHTGYEYEYIPYSLLEGLDMLNSGNIDLFGPIGINPAYLETFGYTSVPFGYQNIVIIAPTDSTFYMDDFENFQGKRIGLTKGSYKERLLVHYMEKHDLDLELIYVDYLKVEEDLHNDLYDLALTGTLHSMHNVKVVAHLGIEPFYYVAHKDNIELVTALDEALTAINTSNFLFSTDLYQKYYSHTPSAHPILTENESNLIQQHKQLTVGFTSDQAPIQYIDDNGIPAGISIDIMNAIAADIGFDITYIPLDLVDYSLDLLDLNLSFISDYIIEDFTAQTTSYVDMPLMLIGAKDYSLDQFQTIGMLNYAYTDVLALQKVFPHLQIKKYKNFDEMIPLLEDGEIDFIFASSVACDGILTEFGSTEYSIYPVDLTLSLPIAVSPDLPPEIVTILDKLIARIPEETLNSITLNHSIDITTSMTAKQFITQNALAISIIAISFVSVFVCSILIVTRTKRHALNRIINEDQLTGLLSEYKFLIDVKKLLSHAQPYDYSLLSIDIDNFKYINEVYGYSKGSLVLKVVSSYLKDIFPSNTLVARISADKFIVLIKSTDLVNFICKKNTYETHLHTHIKELLGETYNLHTSIGIYKVTNPELDLPYMIDCANTAREKGKSSYDDTTFSFTAKMEEERALKNMIVSHMEDALLTKEFKVYYQPKIRLSSNVVIGAEALVRWVPHEKPPVYPNDFIPIFENSGFIFKLDYYVFEEVCAFIQRHGSEYSIPSISVNLSGKTLLRSDLIDTLTHITSQYNVPTEMIELEITESAIISDFDKAIDKINALKYLGFTVSLDDFGSGISSLNRLKDIDIDILKIDRVFLTDTLNIIKGITILENVIKMAKQLHLVTVAEGVETQEHINLLNTLGCDMVQGYFFAKPLCDEDFLNYLASYDITNLE